MDLKNLVSIFKAPNIEFLYEEGLEGALDAPKPASKHMPDWFKKVTPFVKGGGRDDFGGVAKSAKRCMPLLDGMSAGWVITLQGDLHIRTNKDCKLIEASHNPFYKEMVSFHSVDQLGGATSPSYPGPAIKFHNPFVIRTPPGVSSLILPCLNSFEKRFTIMSALVDTDSYMTQINFPAIWNIPNYDGVLEAGTPIATVIPVRRDLLSGRNVTRPFKKIEFKKWLATKNRLSSRSGVYTNEIRHARTKNDDVV